MERLEVSRSVQEGSHQDPANYRPIAMLPILYKVFSKVVCARIRMTVDKAHPVDQAGFPPGFSCDDHLLTMVMVLERCNEFQLPLWAAAIDFQKAFDTAEHGSIWAAMEQMGVPITYIRIFAQLYREQRGVVTTDAESRSF